MSRQSSNDETGLDDLTGGPKGKGFGLQGDDASDIDDDIQFPKDNKTVHEGGMMSRPGSQESGGHVELRDETEVIRKNKAMRRKIK